MFDLKPDFEHVFERYEAWWHCQIVDRPLVAIAFSVPEAHRLAPPDRQPPTIRDQWLDTEYVVATHEARLQNTVHYADALPIAYPNLGPEVFSAFYGCELEFGPTTSWSKPILTDWSKQSLSQLRLDTDNFYFRKLNELTDALLEAAKDTFIVGYTDLHGGGDAIAAFRDPQQLLFDTIEHPDAIKRLCDTVTTDFLSVYDHFHQKLSAAGMPSTTWLPVTGKGKCHVPSNDFSCMIADDVFEDLFVPGIIRECRHMDRCIYHLDGPQALRYLDRLLEIPEIHAIQWVAGAGRNYWADWIHVYQRIQAANKAMQIPSVPAEDLDLMCQSLHPQGVWISSITGIENQHDADAALARIAKWTSKT